VYKIWKFDIFTSFSYTMSLRHQLRDLGIRVVEMIPPMVDTALRSGGRRSRSGSTPGSGRHMMSPDEFAEEGVRRLFENEDEIVVGAAAGLRKDGESRFEMMNRRILPCVQSSFTLSA
jgi:uncharacterized oxidoreductase